MTQRETRELRKQQGLCYNCGKNPRSESCLRCDECKQRQSEYNKTHRRKPKDIAYQQGRREQFKEQGLCYICGKRPKTDPWLQCQYCKDKYKRFNEIPYRQVYKAKAYEAYGGARCACCGETNEKFLTIDHINNDGNVHRREMGWTAPGKRGGGNIHQWLKAHNYPPGFQILCYNCNMGKARNGGRCPHKDVIVMKVAA